MAVVRFKFSADLLRNVVATYFNFSRLVKLSQKLINLCQFVNVVREKVCFPKKKKKKIFDCLPFNISSVFICSPCCEDQRPAFSAAKLRVSVAVESFWVRYLPNAQLSSFLSHPWFGCRQSRRSHILWATLQTFRAPKAQV